MSKIGIWEEAPNGTEVTDYDRLYAPQYLRLLDAESAGAAWKHAAQLILDLDTETDPDRARRIYNSHLIRAKWMVEHGYRGLLSTSKP